MVKNTFNLGVILVAFGLLGSILCFPIKGREGYISIMTKDYVSLQSMRLFGFLEVTFLGLLTLGLVLIRYREDLNVD
ncbi:MAG: hypothetical protein ACE5HY_02885 [Candidatus Hydrothermarchaeales archaeon]